MDLKIEAGRIDQSIRYPYAGPMGESVVAIGHYDRKVFLSERVPYERISASDLVLGTAARENGGLIFGESSAC